MSHLELAEDFVAGLVDSGVVDSDELAYLIWEHDLREMDSAINAAKVLLKKRVITRYQARQILRGRGSSLVVDRYRLLCPVGSGGMGEVFAAAETDSSWQVAIKLLNEDRRKDQGMRSRFQMEAEAGMRLKHPNILRTIEINPLKDEHGNGFYVVMELVKGVSVRELLALHRPISVGQVCDIIIQAASGLHAAHGAGLVHRDVKPENLLVRTDGSVKVCDFGLALLDENDEEFSMAMIMGQNRLGTADYVAPEQIIDSYNVDRHADIYSLGCVMFHWVTGKSPFRGKATVDTLMRHLKAPLPGLPEALIDGQAPTMRFAVLLERMTDKAARNRPQTAAELAAELETLVVA
ncbi:MAG: serine/threonine-protein kinase [Pirellulaceae bacterium]|nr:serine/threonine-protein kinase [Pirellulaceae bacterium]